MKKSELNAIKVKVAERTEKATDLDILVTEIMKLPPGQMKKVLTDEVLVVLEKYRYTEDHE